MKSFIAVFALVVVASARLIPDNSFLPVAGQFDVHPAIDFLPISDAVAPALAASSPLVQIILNIESNDAAPAVNPSIQPVLQPIIPETPIGSIVSTVQVADPIFDTIQIAQPIAPVAPGTIVDTVQVAEPIVPGSIVDTVQVAEPIVAAPIIPVPEPIGIIGIPEILN